MRTCQCGPWLGALKGPHCFAFIFVAASGICYGDQGKWPRQEGKWPHTSTHVSSFKKTEEVIRLLVNLQSSKDTNAAARQVSEMLKSGDCFKQLIGLEFLALRGNGTLLKHLAGAVGELELSTNEAVRRGSVLLMQSLQTEA